MKIDVKKGGDCRVKLSISAAAEDVSETYGKILGSYLRNAQIRGFRRGKAPKDIILRAFGKDIRAEATSTLFNRFVKEAIESEKLDVASVVDAEDMEFDPEKGMSFTAIVDVNPEFKLPKYKGLPVEYHKPSVPEEQVEEQLKAIRDSEARSVETEEPCKDGDYVNVSFASDIDGAGFPEKDKKAAERFISADNFWLQVGEKPYYEAIPGSAKALVGKKKGDDFAMNVEFPADFSIEALRGVKAAYKGKVLKVTTTVPVEDEELCKRLAVESIDDLKGKIRQRLENAAEGAETRRMEDEIEAYFLKKCSFAVPESVVNQAARACGDSVVEAEIRGKDADENYIKDHAEELRAKIDEKATELVRLNYIGKALGKELDLSATEKDVKDAVAAQAMLYSRQGRNFDAEKGYSNLVKNGLVSYYQARILYGRVVEWIINNDIKASAK